MQSCSTNIHNDDINANTQQLIEDKVDNNTDKHNDSPPECLDDHSIRTKNCKKVSYEDMMTGVNELIRTVMDDDELMKSVLTNIDQYTRKLRSDRNVEVIFNSTLNPTSSNHEQSNSHQVP